MHGNKTNEKLYLFRKRRLEKNTWIACNESDEYKVWVSLYAMCLNIIFSNVNKLRITFKHNETKSLWCGETEVERNKMEKNIKDN